MRPWLTKRADQQQFRSFVPASTSCPRFCLAQAYNARRAGELDGLQAEAEATLQHLREQQRALGGREREAAAREKQLAARSACGWAGGHWGACIGGGGFFRADNPLPASLTASAEASTAHPTQPPTHPPTFRSH